MRKILRVILPSVLLVVGMAPVLGPKAREARSSSLNEVITPLDYFQSGREAVETFLRSEDGHASDLTATIERCRRACVRVDIRFGETAAAYQAISASGVLVDDGRKILTAGHSLEGHLKHEIVITLVTGETHTARLLNEEYEIFGGANRDWALMEIVGPPVTSATSVKIGEVREGELAFVLGYPEQIGIDRLGRTAYAGEELAVGPLVTLGTVRQTDPLVLSPRAGSVPLGGMSGGPVFDAQGRLVGLFVSISRVVRADEVSYIYNAASLSSVGRKLEAARADGLLGS